MFTKLFIACDHGGYAAKVRLLKYLLERDVSLDDLGCHSEDIVRYPYYAARVARRVIENPGSGGILICSTGIGMSIAANKYPGIRASMCTSGYMAKMTRLHNDSNILCLGGRISGEFALEDIVDAWLTHEYEGGRHDISLGLIGREEAALFAGLPSVHINISAEEEE